MGLFTPVYYNEKKSDDERSKAIQKERNSKKLQKVAKDFEIGGWLQAIAIEKLRDPSLCEMLLMKYAGKDPIKKLYDLDAYKAAARSLAEMGEQSRLEQIFSQCGNYGIQSIVVSFIENLTFLEEAAINPGEEYGQNPWYTEVAESAVSKITDDAALARVAINSFHNYPAEDAAKRVRGDAQLRDIALQSPFIKARINAVRRMSDSESIIMSLRDEFMPVILENPMKSTFQAILLALCGDTVAKLVLYFTGWEEQCVREGIQECNSHFAESEVLKTDPEILLPVLKKILETLLADKNHETWELVPRVAKCLRLMHENNIASEQIESNFPQTIQYDFEFMVYYGDGYDGGERKNGSETITLW